MARKSEIYPWLPYWVNSNRLFLLVQGHLGYTQKGRGIIRVTLEWSSRSGAFSFQMGTQYLSVEEIEAEIPDPSRIEMLSLIEQYTPETQVIVLFSKPNGEVMHQATLLRGEGFISGVAKSMGLEE